ncbi:CHAP domain-containing protein [Thioclava sp.]|uniref:CHAP domain-containing protein n=1 Tax=Thioclava sp. TaxID=1933450 RepID=UPI003AA88B7A
MPNINTTSKLTFRLPLLIAVLATVAACSDGTKLSADPAMNFASAQEQSGVSPERRAYAVAVAKKMRAQRQRVWCVPFARNASGVEIRGNARTWWSKAHGTYERGHTPKVGAVMAFSSSRKIPLGHVAVVSAVDSPRQIRIDHANWKRNQVSLDMIVMDVSRKNDWSQVRVMSQPNALGSVYPVSGFITNGVQARS